MTDNLAGENFVTASIILPLFYNLKSEINSIHLLDEEEAETKHIIFSTILDVLEKRYVNNVQAYHHLQKCTILDPRFKLQFSDEIIRTNLIKNELIQECQTINIEKSNLEVEDQPSAKIRKTGLCAIFKIQAKNNMDDNDIEKELDSFLNIPVIDIDANPLQWWKSNSASYPRLRERASKYLSTQGTSVPSE